MPDENIRVQIILKNNILYFPNQVSWIQFKTETEEINGSNKNKTLITDIEMLTIRAIIHILRIPLPEGLLLSSLVFFDTITNAIIDRIRPTGKTVEKKNEIIAIIAGAGILTFLLPCL